MYKVGYLSMKVQMSGCLTNMIIPYNAYRIPKGKKKQTASPTQ